MAAEPGPWRAWTGACPDCGTPVRTAFHAEHGEVVIDLVPDALGARGAYPLRLLPEGYADTAPPDYRAMTYREHRCSTG